MPVSFALAIHMYTPPVAFIMFCALVILVLLAKRQVIDAGIFSAIFVITSGFVLTLKYIFAVPRPADALVTLTDYAFPSNHAASSLSIAITIAWLLSKHALFTSIQRISIQIFLILIALGIGLSRLAIGVHTTFQVLVGFGIGIVIPLIIISFYKHYLYKKAAT